MRRVELKNHKRVKVSDVIGNKWSSAEKDWNNKYKIWNADDENMIVSNERPKTISEFAKELKKLHQNLYITFNPNPSTPDKPMGHAIRFRTPEAEDEYDFICGVGLSNEKTIPAMSQVEHFFNKEFNRYETRVTAKGWLAAQEQVIGYLIAKNIAKA